MMKREDLAFGFLSSATRIFHNLQAPVLYSGLQLREQNQLWALLRQIGVILGSSY